jgi:hypothetical protein
MTQLAKVTPFAGGNEADVRKTAVAVFPIDKPESTS